jgi:hypothetical protein
MVAGHNALHARAYKYFGRRLAVDDFWRKEVGDAPEAQIIIDGSDTVFVDAESWDHGTRQLDFPLRHLWMDLEAALSEVQAEAAARKAEREEEKRREAEKAKAYIEGVERAKLAALLAKYPDAVPKST